MPGLAESALPLAAVRRPGEITERPTYDFVIIGSGFGGSVSAMRLTEKGYSVVVLERGRRFEDHEFPKTNWDLRNFLWLTALHCFGIFQMTFMNGQLALHGNGVGGGSLGYGNVLQEPDDRLFESPAWHDLADWRAILQPHYTTARRMLGVARSPHLWLADDRLKEIARELGKGDTFEATQVGVFFGQAGQEGKIVPDPIFRRRRPCAGRLYPLRWLYGWLSLQRQEYAYQELPVFCREVRSAGHSRSHGDGHSAGDRRRCRACAP